MKTDQHTVEFFFDFISPFAYLAQVRIRRMAQAHNFRIHWIPVLYAGLLQHWNTLGPAEMNERREVLFRQVLRAARRDNIPLLGPRFHPFRPLLALRLSLLSVAKLNQDKVIESIFHGGWALEADLASENDLREILEKNNLPAHELLRGAHSDHAKAELRQNTDRAITKGVFGVPSMIYNGELFWGNDSLKDLEAILIGQDVLTKEDVERFLSKPRGEERPQAKMRR